MDITAEFRPDGWEALKEEVMVEVRKRAGNDKDAEAVAESIFEMAGSAMLKLVRTKCGVPAICAMGQIALLTPPSARLSLPGRPGAKAALTIPLTYKKEQKWNGTGVACFIPDDEKLVGK